MKKISKGFTLIEVLIALSILSMISIAFFSTINTSIKINKKNETDIKALHLVQSEVENLRIQIKKTNDMELNIVNLKGTKVSLEVESSYTSDEYVVKIKIEKKQNLLYQISVVAQSQEQFSNKKTEIITQVAKGKGL